MLTETRLHMAGNSIGIIRAFYLLRVRYVNLTRTISMYVDLLMLAVYLDAFEQQCIRGLLNIQNRPSTRRSFQPRKVCCQRDEQDW